STLHQLGGIFIPLKSFTTRQSSRDYPRGYQKRGFSLPGEPRYRQSRRMDHASHKRTRLAKQLSLLEALVWILAVVVAWWWILSATEQALQSAIYYASMVSVLAGVRAFLGHGKNIITATGLYGLSTGMFIGYSGIILAGQPTIDPPWYYLALASGAGLTAQIGTTLLAWRYTPTRVSPTHWFQARSANWAVGAGLLMLGLAVALQLI